MDGLHLDRRLTPMHGGVAVRPGILSYLRAGSGVGGSCLPKDVRALAAFASSQGVSAPMLHAVMEVNDRRPKVLVSRLRALLGDLAGCKIAVLGIAFKPGTDDTRDSPAWKLIDELHAGDADVHVFDPVAAVRSEE